MKKLMKYLVFICLQCVVIGLSILVGWNYGLPADRQRLKDQENSLNESWYYLQHEALRAAENAQSTIELLQSRTNVAEAIEMLNKQVDYWILSHNGLRGSLSSIGYYEWPSGEDQFVLTMRIAEYRKQYPVNYKNSYGNRQKSDIERVFSEAEKCQQRRASGSWKPIRAGDGELIIIEQSSDEDVATRAAPEK